MLLFKGIVSARNHMHQLPQNRGKNTVNYCTRSLPYGKSVLARSTLTLAYEVTTFTSNRQQEIRVFSGNSTMVPAKWKHTASQIREFCLPMFSVRSTGKSEALQCHFKRSVKARSPLSDVLWSCKQYLGESTVTIKIKIQWELKEKIYKILFLQRRNFEQWLEIWNKTIRIKAYQEQKGKQHCGRIVWLMDRWMEDISSPHRCSRWANKSYYTEFCSLSAILRMKKFTRNSLGSSQASMPSMYMFDSNTREFFIMITMKHQNSLSAVEWRLVWDLK